MKALFEILALDVNDIVTASCPGQCGMQDNDTPPGSCGANEADCD